MRAQGGRLQQGRSVVQFTKTQMCKFEIVGMCSKGTQCSFAHSAHELNALPDLRCTQLCKTLIQNGACYNPDCLYAHNKEELRTSNAANAAQQSSFKSKGRRQVQQQQQPRQQIPSVPFFSGCQEVPPPPGLGSWDTQPTLKSKEAFMQSPAYIPTSPTSTMDELTLTAAASDSEEEAPFFVSYMGLTGADDISPLHSSSGSYEYDCQSQSNVCAESYFGSMSYWDQKIAFEQDHFSSFGEMSWVGQEPVKVQLPTWASP